MKNNNTCEHNLYTSGPVIIIEWEDNTFQKTKSVTANFLQLGYSRKELLNDVLTYHDLIHPDDKQAALTDKLEQCNKPPYFFEQSYRLRKNNGETIWVHDYSLLEKNNESTNCRSYIMDITRLIIIQENVFRKDLESRMLMLAKFPEENPNPVFRVSIDGEVHYSNKSSGELLAFWLEHEEQVLPGYLRQAIQKVLQENEPTEIEVAIDKNIFLFSITPIKDSKDAYIYGIDITDKRKTEKELQLTSKIFETTLEGIFVTDPDGTIQSINPSFSTITGYSADEAIGQNPRLLKSERHQESFYKTLWEDLIKNGTWSGEIWNRRKNGETYPQWTSISTLKDDAGQTQNFVAVFTDITDIKIKEAEIEYRAFHDPLTGLPNRSLMDDRLEQAVAHAKRYNKKLALLFMDLDRFKIINDSLGHIFGDYLLQHVAKRLIGSIRDDDTVSRIGGDEFVILLPEITDISTISIIAERILEAFVPPFRLKEHELYVVPSIGIALFPEDGNSATELFKYADLAMYDSKNSGGNRYHFYSDNMEKIVKKKLTMENKIRQALKQENFTLHYQPIVDISNNSIAGAEALLRWNDPNLGSVSPDDFIPLAEETGIIIDINDWVIETTAKDMARLASFGYDDIYFSINITSHHFFQGKIITSVKEAIHKHNLHPKNLVIEITENSLMDNVEENISIMRELKKQGIRFSIDDFGTGYSSLSYLKKFPLDNLKIDKSFITDLHNDQESMEIVKTIITLSKSLGLKIISEGVETEQQLQFFREQSCEFIQGYLFSKPLPFEEFSLLLKKSRKD